MFHLHEIRLGEYLIRNHFLFSRDNTRKNTSHVKDIKEILNEQNISLRRSFESY